MSQRVASNLEQYQGVTRTPEPPASPCDMDATRKGDALPNERGWPDAAHPGVAGNPHRDGPHLIEKDGHRVWVWWNAKFRAYIVPSQPVTGLNLRGVLDPRQAAAEWTYRGAAVVADGEPVP